MRTSAVCFALAATFSALSASAQQLPTASAGTSSPEDLPAVQIDRPTTRAMLALRAFGFVEAVPSTARSAATGWIAGGGGSVGSAVYFQPVVDDAAPIALQPFLQRLSSFTFRASASASDEQLSASPGSSFGASGIGADATLGLDAYLHRAFAVWASLGFEYEKSTPTTPTLTMTGLSILVLSIDVGIGLRFGDTRLDLGYGITPTTYGATGDPWQLSNWGPFQPLFPGGAELSVRTVLSQRFDLRFAGRIIPDGLSTSASIDWYPTRTFGLHASLLAAHGFVYPNSSSPDDRFGGIVGLERWFTPHLGLSAQLDVIWTSSFVSTLDNEIAVSLLARL